MGDIDLTELAFLSAAGAVVRNQHAALDTQRRALEMQREGLAMHREALSLQRTIADYERQRHDLETERLEAEKERQRAEREEKKAVAEKNKRIITARRHLLEIESSLVFLKENFNGAPEHIALLAFTSEYGKIIESVFEDLPDIRAARVFNDAFAKYIALLNLGFDPVAVVGEWLLVIEDILQDTRRAIERRLFRDPTIPLEEIQRLNALFGNVDTEAYYAELKESGIDGMKALAEGFDYCDVDGKHHNDLERINAILTAWIKNHLPSQLHRIRQQLYAGNCGFGDIFNPQAIVAQRANLSTQLQTLDNELTFLAEKLPITLRQILPHTIAGWIEKFRCINRVSASGHDGCCDPGMLLEALSLRGHLYADLQNEGRNCKNYLDALIEEHNAQCDMLETIERQCTEGNVITAKRLIDGVSIRFSDIPYKERDKKIKTYSNLLDQIDELRSAIANQTRFHQKIARLFGIIPSFQSRVQRLQRTVRALNDSELKFEAQEKLKRITRKDSRIIDVKLVSQILACVFAPIVAVELYRFAFIVYQGMTTPSERPQTKPSVASTEESAQENQEQSSSAPVATGKDGKAFLALGKFAEKVWPNLHEVAGGIVGMNSRPRKSMSRAKVEVDARRALEFVDVHITFTEGAYRLSESAAGKINETHSAKISTDAVANIAAEEVGKALCNLFTELSGKVSDGAILEIYPGIVDAAPGDSSFDGQNALCYVLGECNSCRMLFAEEIAALSQMGGAGMTTEKRVDIIDDMVAQFRDKKTSLEAEREKLKELIGNGQSVGAGPGANDDALNGRSNDETSIVGSYVWTWYSGGIKVTIRETLNADGTLTHVSTGLVSEPLVFNGTWRRDGANILITHVKDGRTDHQIFRQIGRDLLLIENEGSAVEPTRYQREK